MFIVHDLLIILAIIIEYLLSVKDHQETSYTWSHLILMKFLKDGVTMPCLDESIKA